MACGGFFLTTLTGHEKVMNRTFKNPFQPTQARRCMGFKAATRAKQTKAKKTSKKAAKCQRQK
jgi:hypothetical protein